MSQFPHDKFAKNLFELLLTPFGSVNLQRVIQSETKFVDIYFEPNPNPPDSANLGLLAQCLNQHPAIFEPFRNPVTVDDIQMCLVKVFEVQQELNREHKRLKQPFPARVTPRLWILTPTLAAHTLGKFGAANEVEIWGKACPERSRRGVYILPEHLQMGMIVVHQLPQIPQTRWFRLMGKGKVQQTAVAELAALPLSDPYRGDALDLFLSLRLELEAKQTIDIEEQELIMQLSPLYLEKIQAAKREGEIIGEAKGEARGEARGEAKGEAKGEARMVVRLLNRRLGSVPEQFSAQIQQLTVSQLEDLGEALLDFTSLIDLENWLS